MVSPPRIPGACMKTLVRRRSGLVLTRKQLHSAVKEVRSELRALGFLDEALSVIEVLMVPRAFPYAYQLYGGDGNIYVPRISGARKRDLKKKLKPAPIRQVLRHEFAHAFADTHRGLIRSARFSEAFGAAHSWKFAWKYDPEHHVSDYASSAPAEDFAETFMHYIGHQGVLPEKWNTPSIRRKWRFIRDLARAATRGIRRW